MGEDYTIKDVREDARDCETAGYDMTAKMLYDYAALLERQASAVPDGKLDGNFAGHKLYSRWVDEQGIHCNRFPSWGELDQSDRDGWVRKAAPHPKVQP